MFSDTGQATTLSCTIYPHAATPARQRISTAPGAARARRACAIRERRAGHAGRVANVAGQRGAHDARAHNRDARRAAMAAGGQLLRKPLAEAVGRQAPRAPACQQPRGLRTVSMREAAVLCPWLPAGPRRLGGSTETHIPPAAAGLSYWFQQMHWTAPGLGGRLCLPLLLWHAPDKINTLLQCALTVLQGKGHACSMSV